jgi:hypothetical protein
MVYPVLGGLLTIASLQGQNVSIGIIGGTNLTDDVRSGRSISPVGFPPAGSMTFVVERGVRRPIGGIQFDYGFRRNWSLEFDVLRREVKRTETYLYNPPLQFGDGRPLSSAGPFTGTLTPWEFPLLVKYKLPVRRPNLFIAAGPSFRPAGSGSSLSHAGITAGAGVAFQTKAGWRVSPTLRYTRWQDRPAGFTIGRPLLNQVEVLVGFDRPSAQHRASIFGRRFVPGIIAGIGVGRDFIPGRFFGEEPERNSGIFGVMLEVPLSERFALEADALYRPLHGAQREFTRRVRFAHLTWEFPVLLKYRLPRLGPVTPFAEGGPSFRAEGNLNLQPVSHFGGTVGAGIEYKWKFVKMSPMVRYTRWGGSQADTVTSRVSPNQVQLLVAFSL